MLRSSEGRRCDQQSAAFKGCLPVLDGVVGTYTSDRSNVIGRIFEIRCFQYTRKYSIRLSAIPII